MPTESKPAESKTSRTILVAGDVCLDVLGVPQPPRGDVDCPGEENWRLTGEIRTHLLPGGAMLLAEFVRNAAPQVVVRGPMAVRPAAIAAPAGAQPTLNVEQYLEIAERLTRKDIVHSLLGVKEFPATGKKDEKQKILRIEKCHGYSGPPDGTPTLAIEYPSGDATDVVLIDDTGNRFNRR